MTARKAFHELSESTRTRRIDSIRVSAPYLAQVPFRADAARLGYTLAAPVTFAETHARCAQGAACTGPGCKVNRANQRGRFALASV